jgi:hypothetical protein
LKTLEKIDAQIEVLKARKQKITAIDKSKQRKLEVKQKIIVGGFFLKNTLMKMEKEKALQYLNKINEEIPSNRRSDKYAVQQLIEVVTNEQ